MTLPWFRMYGEFLTDPLIRLLSFEDQRHFIAALCMKASGVTDKCYASVTVRVTVISSLIGLSKEPGADGQSALDKANERLKSLGLVDDNWQPINWNKRQFQSDHTDKTSAERMRRMRAKKRSTVTGDVTVTRVTPVEQIQNRTDTEQKEEDFVFKERPTTIDLETNRIEKIPKAETPNGNYHATEFHPRYVEVREFIVNRLPKLKTTNASEVNRWLMSGADPEGDIFPNIEHCIEFRRGDIGSFNYFTNSITSSIQIKKERTEQESRMREKYAKSN